MSVSDDENDADAGMSGPQHQLDEGLLESDALGEVLAGFDLVGDDFTFDGEDGFFNGFGL